MLQREYFKQGKLEQFRQILEEGSGSGNHSFPALAISEIVLFVNFCFVLAIGA